MKISTGGFRLICVGGRTPALLGLEVFALGLRKGESRRGGWIAPLLGVETALVVVGGGSDVLRVCVGRVVVVSCTAANSVAILEGVSMLGSGSSA